MKNDPPTYSAMTRYRGLPSAPKKHDELQAIIQADISLMQRATGIAALELVKARIEDALQAGGAQVFVMRVYIINILVSCISIHVCVPYCYSNLYLILVI